MAITVGFLRAIGIELIIELPEPFITAKLEERLDIEALLERSLVFKAILEEKLDIKALKELALLIEAKLENAFDIKGRVGDE